MPTHTQTRWVIKEISSLLHTESEQPQQRKKNWKKQAEASATQSVTDFQLWLITWGRKTNKQRNNEETKGGWKATWHTYERCIFYKPGNRVYKTTQPHVRINHSHKEGERGREGGEREEKKKCAYLCVCVFVCSWVWARLQLRGEAIAIPTDLKTSLPATSKYRGTGREKIKGKRENVSEHEGDENTEGEI